MDAKILELVEFPYYFHETNIENFKTHASLAELKLWTESVGMTLYYHASYLYFENEEDKAMFIIKWIDVFFIVVIILFV